MIEKIFKPVPVETPSGVKAELLKTDLKTHALVVLSNLLLGFGFFLAGASAYLVTIVPPVVALAAPIIPIVLGVLGLRYSAPTSGGLFDITSPLVYQPAPFPGIINGGHNCWLNAALQGLFNVPALEQKLDSSGFFPSGLGPLTSMYKTYKNEVENGHKGASSIDSQVLRKWMASNSRGIISPDILVQEDVVEGLGFLFPRLGITLPVITEKKVVDGKETTLVIKDQNYFQPFLDWPHEKAKNMQKAFQRYFSHTEGTTTTLRLLKQTPDDFGVSIPGDAEAGKSTGKNTIQASLHFFDKEFGESSAYHCDYFALHDGGMNYGHWVAYVKKEGKWYLMDDKRGSLVSEKEALQKLNRASFAHYQRV